MKSATLPSNRERRFRLLVEVLLLLFSTVAASGQKLEVWDNFYPERLIAPLPAGVLGRPFGESVVVQGKLVEGPLKGEDLDGRLLVQRINGVATQQGVVIRFDPITPGEEMRGVYGKYLEGDKLWQAREKKLQAMEGKSFEMRGYEYGAHSGWTDEQMWTLQEDVQNSGFAFRLFFTPLMMKPIPEVHFAPGDFVGRIAEFEGRAESRDGAAWLVGAEGWALRVRDSAGRLIPRSASSGQKAALRKTPGVWRMRTCGSSISPNRSARK